MSERPSGADSSGPRDGDDQAAPAGGSEPTSAADCSGHRDGDDTASPAGGSEPTSVAAGPYRCGIVAVAGRPNAGKSTLINRIVAHKVSIVSNKPQTTRTQLRGVLTRPDAQLVLVDTPGIHKPRTAAGRHTNAAATEALDGVDVTCLVVDASAPYGRGDAFVAGLLSAESVVVVTKSDLVRPKQMLAQLSALGELDFEAYFPVSGRTGDGVEALVEHLISRLPPGEALYPPEVLSDATKSFRVAELVREQLLAEARDELPYAIATRVTDWDWPVIRCEIIVERPSQKAIVIGHRGSRLAEVGKAVRSQLPDGAYLQLVVKVERNWQRRS